MILFDFPLEGGGLKPILMGKSERVTELKTLFNLSVAELSLFAICGEVFGDYCWH